MSVYLREHHDLRQPSRWHKLRENPFKAKVLMKRKSPPRTPSTAHSLFPFSGTHWGTVLASAPVTQHFPHSTVSLPIAFAFPFLLAAFICMREMSRGLPSVKKKKRFPSTLHMMHHKPKTWHSLCTWTWIQLFTFDMETGWFWIGLWRTATPRCVWNLSAAGTKERSVWGQTAAAATDFESRRCDASQKNSLEQLNLTSSPSGQSTPPSRLAINKPLPSVLLPLFPVWGLCTSVRKSSFHSLAQQDATQPVSSGREGKCFTSGENCLLLCCLHTNSILSIQFSNDVGNSSTQYQRGNRYFFKHHKEWAIYCISVSFPHSGWMDIWIRLVIHSSY